MREVFQCRHQRRESFATPIDEAAFVRRAINVELRDKPNDWAEHHVSITTVAGAPPARAPQRLALFVGISQYKNGHNLKASHNDAIQFSKFMQEHGKLTGVCQLTDADANLAHIRRAFDELVAITQPNDEVFIFWSGHGGRIDDDNGDEKDGQDEVLAPYDGLWDSLENIRKTNLVDDTFGRWVQELDGRKVVVVLDTCFAAGHSSQAKTILSAQAPFDFWAGERERAKDIGQGQTALLCACQANQTCCERPDGSLSVMTYYLLEALSDRGAPRVTLDESFNYLKDRVYEYVRQMDPAQSADEVQRPFLVNDIRDNVFLRY